MVVMLMRELVDGWFLQPFRLDDGVGLPIVKRYLTHVAGSEEYFVCSFQDLIEIQ